MIPCVEAVREQPFRDGRARREVLGVLGQAIHESPLCTDGGGLQPAGSVA